jgi:hypothetical protein
VTMANPEERELSKIRELRRNRYFAGQLLTAERLEQEQAYYRRRERLLNRLVLGSGVVSGLAVEGVEGGVVVEPGVAVDGWGRLIVVPEAWRLVPLVLTDDAGETADGKETPDHLVISLTYGEYAPGDGTCAETFVVCVNEGSADPVTHRCLDEAREALDAGKLHKAACALAGTAVPALPDDPRVPLANVTTTESPPVVDCAPRPIVAAHELLLTLVACLAERVEKQPRRLRRRSTH